jgi:hypothetical protein
MHPIRWAALSAFVAAGCQTYTPAPVDLLAHARLFAERIPDATLVRAFAETLRQHGHEVSTLCSIPTHSP